jgi:hypothetical protein
MSKFCNKVITIPQYEPTCWFNAILMAILYSQYSRKLLLNDKILAQNNSKIAKIIKNILKYQYVSNKYTEQYFNIMTPGKILKYLNLIDDFRLFITKGWFSDFFLPIFIEKACFKRCLILDLYKGNIYVEFQKKIRFVNILKDGNNEGSIFYDDKITDIDLQNHILKKLNEPNPDYIFLSITEPGNDYLYSKHLINNSERIDNIINLKNYTVFTSGLNETKDVITYKDDEYILDSCIINNYNSKIIGASHAIVGITCKKEKYVYNGWIRSTKDPAMLINKNIKKYDKDSQDNKLLPCELMKFNWNVNDKDSSFCINHKLCKLDIIKKSDEFNDLCFSFGKDTRTLIYVKQPKKKITSINTNIFSSNSNPITLPTISTQPEDIFADIKIDNQKKILYKNLKDKMKKNKVKKELQIKLKELQAKEAKLEKEIAYLKLKIK